MWDLERYAQLSFSMKELRSQTYGCSFIIKQLSNYSFTYDCNPESLALALAFPFPCILPRSSAHAAWCPYEHD